MARVQPDARNDLEKNNSVERIAENTALKEEEPQAELLAIIDKEEKPAAGVDVVNKQTIEADISNILGALQFLVRHHTASGRSHSASALNALRPWRPASSLRIHLCRECAAVVLLLAEMHIRQLGRTIRRHCAGPRSDCLHPPRWHSQTRQHRRGQRGGRRAGPLNHSHVGDGGEGKEISVESGLARRVRRVVEESGKFNARPDLKGCVRCEGESLRLKARGIRLSFTAR